MAFDNRISSTVGADAVYAAHVSKTAIENIEGMQSNAISIDGGLDIAKQTYNQQLWEAPAQPPLRTDEVSELPLYENIFTVNGNDIIDRYEEYRSLNPLYITREVLGKDSSYTYDIYKYIFEPEGGYEKTLILSTLTHGSEVSAPIALLRFLGEVINNTYTHPLLTYIRNKVRLIIVPNVNHWGSMQSPRKRTNSNQVDINRNYDYRWDEYPLSSIGSNDYKGTAAFSESESSLMRDLFIEYADEAVGYIDFHNFGSNVYGDDNIAPMVLPKEFPNLSNEISKLQHRLKDNNTDFANSQFSYKPAGYIYCQANHNIYCCNPEWTDAEIWGASYSSLSLQKQVKYVGNLIGLYSKLEKSPLRIISQGNDVHYLYFTNGATSIPTISTSSNTVVEELDFTIPNCNQAGYIKVTGAVSIKLVSGDATNIRASHNLSQVNTVLFGAEDTTFNDDIKTGFFQNLGTVKDINDYVTLPIISIFPVVATNGIVPSPKLQFVCSGGTTSIIQIMRYRCIVEYIRSDKGDETLKYFTSNDVNNPMALEYPKN